MNIHFIAVGGAVMHNMAIALKKKGFRVSGSDDEIFEPSRGRLNEYGLLPEKSGWDPDRITPDLDAVILGMHARKDNPELEKAIELGLKIYSFPEYLFEQSKDKIRVVIGGSHGKTTITSMVMHVMQYFNMEFDYMVGSQIEGFDTMVKITDDAPVIILEGDEYLSSPLDPRPKFHLYKPHIALLTGVAWDHMNVFPTFDEYLEQFMKFTRCIEPAGKLYYFKQDPHLNSLINGVSSDIETESYDTHHYKISPDGYHLLTDIGEIAVPLIGKHNMQNIEASRLLCRDLGISSVQFYKAIRSFRGAAKRQQLLAENKQVGVYLDFAHAPSKVEATVAAFREANPDKKLIACLELHTFSSLNRDYLPHYKGTLDAADRAIVFFNPEVVTHKNLPALALLQVRSAFGKKDLEVINDREELKDLIQNIPDREFLLVIMTSGNFSGIDLNELANSLVNQ